MENQLLVVLPEEVAQIAKNVSAEKRAEVLTVLNSVFNGVSKMREQLEKVVVEDENDKVNMKLANTIRLGVRQVRLDAEKVFDAKRAEVQQQMLSYKTEDALWLKSKQTMQILTKEIEELARWLEETRKRFEAEQKELKIQGRILKVQKFNPEIARTEFESMSDAMFDLFLSGIEKQYNERIEAEQKAEAERIAKEKAEEEERERIRLENIRLKKEADAKEKILAAERAKAEKERKEAEDRLNKEKQAAKIAADKAAAERAKLEAQIKAKADQEAANQKAKEQAEKKAKNAPDKEKLIQLALDLEYFEFPEVKAEEAAKILADVKSLLQKVTVYIREKSSTL